MEYWKVSLRVRAVNLRMMAATVNAIITGAGAGVGVGDGAAGEETESVRK